MELLTNELRARLLQFHAQDAQEEPTVYAKFILPGTSRVWYVTEGYPEGGDFVFYGFVTRPTPAFRTFRLSELKAKRNLFDQPVERDTSFVEARLTDVIPAPES